VQVISNVMVQVPFVYVAWFSRYSCSSGFYRGLVHGNTVLPLSESKTIDHSMDTCSYVHF